MHQVDNYPGFSKSSGQNILMSLMEQVRNLDIEIKYGSVQTILKEENGFEVVTDIDSYECKAVIIASGRSIPSVSIKNEKEYAGKGVSYCATCDGNFFKGYDVAVVGNNEIVLEESIYLSGLANKVYVVVPDESLDGNTNLVNKVKNIKNIEILLGANVQEIVGEHDFVTGLKVNDKIISVAGVFPYVGKKGSEEF